MAAEWFILYSFPLATPPEPSPPLSASSNPPPSGDNGKLWLLSAHNLQLVV